MSEEKQDKSCNYGFSAEMGGAVMSVDMAEMDFFLACGVDRAVSLVSGLFSAHVDGWSVERYAKLNVAPSSKWAFFTNHLWGGGFHVSVGVWQKFDKEDKRWLVLPYLRLRFNPNKHRNDRLYVGFRSLLSEYSLDGQLVKYDLALDFPVPKSAITVHSRKERGLYKGTLYFGQRNLHGRLKVYDKGKEQGLDTPLTRVEWTFRTDRKRVFDDVYVLTGDRLTDYQSLPKQTRNVISLLLHLVSCKEDIAPHLDDLDRRMRKKIEPYVVGTGIQLSVSEVLADSLIDALSRDFNVTWAFDFVKLGFSEAGFVSGSTVSEDQEAEEMPPEQLELPF